MGKDDQSTNIGCSQCKSMWAKIIQKESDVRFDYLDDFVDTEQNDPVPRRVSWTTIISDESTYNNSSFFTSEMRNKYNNKSNGINSMKIPSLTLQNLNLLSVFGIDTNITNRLKYKTIRITQFSPQHVASQLCRIDSRLINLIEWSELRTGSWLSKDNATNAKNVLDLIRFFNKMTLIVVNTILSLNKINDRKHAIEYFIKLAEILYKLNNFNSMQAVIAALNQQAIFRLKQTWNIVPGHTLQRYEKLLDFLDMKDNYKVYRTKVKELTTSQSSMLPFFGIFLSDVNGVLSYSKFKHEQIEKLAKKEQERLQENCELDNLKKSQTSEPFYQVDTICDSYDIYGSVKTVDVETFPRRNLAVTTRQNAIEYSESGSTSLSNKFISIPRTTPVSDKDKDLAEDITKSAEKPKENIKPRKLISRERRFGKKINLQSKKSRNQSSKINCELENEEENKESEFVVFVKKELDEIVLKMKEIEETFHLYKIQAAYYNIDSCSLLLGFLFTTEVLTENEFYKKSLEIEPGL